MNQYHWRHKTKLAKWLLVAALFCSLFAFLGGDIYSQDRQQLATKTELVAATGQEITQRGFVYNKVSIKRLFISHRNNYTTTLLSYNSLIITIIRLFCNRQAAFTKANTFVQIKTIPISSDELHLPTLRG